MKITLTETRSHKARTIKAFRTENLYGAIFKRLKAPNRRIKERS